MQQSQEMREKIQKQYDDNVEKKFTNVSFFSLFRKNKFWINNKMKNIEIKRSKK